LHACLVKLRLGLCYVCPWGRPAFEAIFRELERIAVALDCVVQKLLLRIGVANFKVVDCNLGVQT
jgi:hypothetical protein